MFAEQVQVDEGSIYKVPYTKILDIQPHPNAERLEVATIYGFQVVVRKFEYSVGDEIFYIPIDSILPFDLEAIIFPPESKVKLHKCRVRQIRLRGLASQGMIISKSDIMALIKARGAWFVGDFTLEQDYAEFLGISKYQPPVKVSNVSTGPKNRKSRTYENPAFHQYNGISNFKWFPLMFKEDEEIVVQEKLHGANIRFGYLPTTTDTLWKKVLKFFGRLPDYEYVYGSNNVQITGKGTYTGWYGEDIYGKAIKRIGALEKLQKNETVFGELIGEGIQKHYDYGHADHHIVIFDVKVYDPETKTHKWLSPDEVEVYAKDRGFDFVPVLYKGLFKKDFALSLSTGPSVYYKPHKVREGVVLKSRFGYNDEHCSSGKRCLKVINEAYLDDESNTDFQ